MMRSDVCCNSRKYSDYKLTIWSLSEVHFISSEQANGSLLDGYRMKSGSYEFVEFCEICVKLSVG